MTEITLTLTLTVDAAEYAEFVASHIDPRDVRRSFNARLNEVFGPGVELTTARVTDLRNGSDLERVRERLRWHQTALDMKREWLRQTDPGGWIARHAEEERRYGAWDGLMTAWGEVNAVQHGEGPK